MSAVPKPLAGRRVRVALRLADATLAAELGGMLAQAGLEVVDAAGEADVVMQDVAGAGFAPLAESDLGTLLTPREIEVLSAIAEGLSNKSIARRLDISLHTVKFHVESLFRKLGVRTRTEAVVKVSELRLEI